MATVWLSGREHWEFVHSVKGKQLYWRKEEQLEGAKNSTDLFKSHNEMFSLLRACIDMETNDFHKAIDWESNAQGWERQHKVI